LSVAGGTPWLSVLVPVFNVAPYLAQCVDSVMQQADDGVELLLLDDSSSDGSAALMHALQTKWGDRVRLLAHEENRGIAAVRNTLLAQARGDHLWFVDGDDWIADHVLPSLKTLVCGASAPDLVFFDYRVVRTPPRLKYRLRGEHHKPGFAGPSRRRVEGAAAVLHGALATGNLFVWTQVSRRALWHRDGATLQFPAGRSFEDIATVPRLLARATSAWHVPVPWVMYRRRHDSITALMSPSKVTDLSASLLGARDELLRWLSDAPHPPRFALAHQASRNFIAALRHIEHLPGEQSHVLRQQIRADFLATVGDDMNLLWQGYLQRGWGLRAWRLQRALRGIQAQ